MAYQDQFVTSMFSDRGFQFRFVRTMARREMSKLEVRQNFEKAENAPIVHNRSRSETDQKFSPRLDANMITFHQKKLAMQNASKKLLHNLLHYLTHTLSWRRTNGKKINCLIDRCQERWKWDVQHRWSWSETFHSHRRESRWSPCYSLGSTMHASDSFLSNAAGQCGSDCHA